MAFATKKNALNWAKHYLVKSETAGSFVDPIAGGVVQPVKIDGAWCFGFGYRDSWLNDVEDLREATGTDQ